MYDPTNTTDELNRKTLDAVMDVVKKYKEGYRNYGETKASLYAIENAVGGLISSEVTATLWQVIEDINIESYQTKRILIWQSVDNFKKAVYCATWCVGTSSLKVTNLYEMEQKTFNCQSPEQAKTLFQKLWFEKYHASNCTILFGDLSDSWA